MQIVMVFLISINPFFEANFSSLPSRSLSVYVNPAGTGLAVGAEAFLTYHPDILQTGFALGNLGLGLTKTDDLTSYEAGIGFKLPGAFSVGYAYQFEFSDEYEINEHIIGLICLPNPMLSLGYRTTLGSRNHMLGGFSIRPYKEYVTLSFDLEYEGIDSILTYYYGGMIQPLPGVKMHFQANEDLDWVAGIGLSWGYLRVAGAYSSSDERFSAGIILSAQRYESVLNPTPGQGSPDDLDEYYY